jgi:hypothetical protein
LRCTESSFRGARTRPARSGATAVHAIDVDRRAVANKLTNSCRKGSADEATAEEVDLYESRPDGRYEAAGASLYQVPVDPFEQLSSHRPRASRTLSDAHPLWWGRRTSGLPLCSSVRAGRTLSPSRTKRTLQMEPCGALLRARRRRRLDMATLKEVNHSGSTESLPPWFAAGGNQSSLPALQSILRSTGIASSKAERRSM